MGLEVVSIERGELLGRILLPAEQLDHPHAREAFLQIRVQPCQPDPDVAERFSHSAAEDCRGEPDQRNDRERHQCQTPVHQQHHRHDRQQREHIAEHGDHPGGKQLVQRLDVRGHPGHQAAYRVPIEIADAEPLQMGEDLHPEVVHDPLPDVGGQQRLPILHTEVHQQGGQEDRGQTAEQAGIVVRNGDVERALGERRPDQRQPRAGQKKQHRKPRQTTVGPQVGQQAAKQRRVIASVEDFVLFAHRIRVSACGFHQSRVLHALEALADPGGEDQEPECQGEVTESQSPDQNVDGSELPGHVG